MDCFAGMPPRRATVRAGDIRLSYLEWGNAGHPLMILHGITSSARSMWRVGPALAERGYHVFALDMPGHGESDETTGHRIEAIARLVGVAMRDLGLDNAVLIGHSWGGATALALATLRERPSLSRVVLVDPLLRMDRAWGEARLPFYLKDVGLPPEVTLPALRASNPDWHECDVRWKAEALVQCRTNAVRGLFIGSGNWNLIPRLAQVDVPLLLLVADPQHTIIPATARAEAERMLRPGLGQIVTVPGTNHNMLRGGYDAVMPILVGWLEQGEDVP